MQLYKAVRYQFDFSFELWSTDFFFLPLGTITLAKSSYRRWSSFTALHYHSSQISNH